MVEKENNTHVESTWLNRSHYRGSDEGCWISHCRGQGGEEGATV